LDKSFEQIPGKRFLFIATFNSNVLNSSASAEKDKKIGLLESCVSEIRERYPYFSACITR
jgi:hypothetical protein